ncbi:MAG: hypothetical protein IMF19_04745, partial [Proteobacteria bacterium]|nr:hypothetical protein [Pseudomonadota bacterium]
MAVEIGAGYIANALLQNLVIPEIAKRLAGKAGEKGAKLKDINKPEWLQKIGQWLDDNNVSTPEKVEECIKKQQEKIVRALTEQKGELSDLGKPIFEAINELKDRIDKKELRNEDNEFLDGVKESFNPDEFEKRLEKILEKSAKGDLQKIRNELTLFFGNMGWDNMLNVIKSKVDLVLQSIEDVKDGIEGIEIKIDEIGESSKIKIQYFPDTPPNVTVFVDRVTHLDDLRNSLAKKNTIIIQGIAGIGKTQLAAKLQQNINVDYTTFWKELRDVDTFDSLSRTLAGFLREKKDPELAEYIESGPSEHDTIIHILLRSLENKNYVLFFDNYHVVENKEIHDLFKQFKDRLKGSTIVITTRNPPPFVSPIDRGKKQVTEKGIEGFDFEATKKYLEQMRVKVSQEQLTEIVKRLSGHPLSLQMFVSLEGEMEVSEILEDLPETGIEQYLYDEIYERLDDDEKKVLQAISVFRTPVTSEACVHVAGGGNVKEMLRRLRKKLIVKNKEKLYYLHDLIREFS